MAVVVEDENCEESDDNDDGTWEPEQQQAACFQRRQGTEVFQEIRRWREAQAREKAEARATKSGGLFDFDDLVLEPPKVDPREPLHVPQRLTWGKNPDLDEQVRFAEKASQKVNEDEERRRTCRSARQQIRDALAEELAALPMGDPRRRELRKKAAAEIAAAPPDPPPTAQEMKEWGMSLCTLQKEDRDPKSVPIVNPDGTLEPHRAVVITETEALEILERRADVNVRWGDLKRYPLHAAAEKCYPKLIAELVKARADPNKADFAGEIPLHTAAHSGGWCSASSRERRLAIENLVEGRANINFANPRGRTPLHIAASAGDSIVIRALIAEGADVNAADLGGFTSLMWAAGHGQQEEVKALLDSEADPALQANRGQTAMLFALTNNYSLVAHVLESHIVVGSQKTLRQAEQEEKKAATEGGVDNGVDVLASRNTQTTGDGGAGWPKQTLHFPYMGLVLQEYVPDMSSNVY